MSSGYPEISHAGAENGTESPVAPPGRAVGFDNPRESPRRLLNHAFNYFLGKLIPGLMGFVSVVVFVRLVGYEQYGRYAVVFAIVMASASGMGGWLAQGILRFQSQMSGPSEANNFASAWVTGTFLSIAVGGCGLAAVIWFSGIQRNWLLLVSLGLYGVLLAYTVALARLQASLRSRQVFLFESMRALGGFVIPAILMLVFGSRAYWLLLLGIGLGYSLPLLVPSLSRVRTLLPTGSRTDARGSTGQRAVLAKLWNFGWPVALWLLCQQSLLVSDRFFLQRFAGYSQAGIYSSIYDVVVRSLSLLFMPVTLAVHPLIMNHWNAGDARAAFAALRSGVKYQLLLFVPIVVSFSLFGSWIARFVLGKETPLAATIVLPLAISGFLWQLCLLAHKPLEILCLTKRMLAGMVVALSVNVAGNWLLIPRFGYRAAAYLSLASSAAYLLMLLVLTPMRELRKAAASVSLPSATTKAHAGPSNGSLVPSP